MSSDRWTPSQKSAIDYRGKNLILSAAAGSGKTDTLTERIIRLIGEGTPLSRILAVTFTNAAAAELRERIGASLEEMCARDPRDTNASQSLAAIDSAGISTIHSFFKSEIAPFSSKFGLSPDFEIIDDAECRVMQKEAMSQTTEFFFNAPTEEYEYLCECISSAKKECSLEEALLEIRKTLISYRIDPTSFAEINDTDFMSSPTALPVKKSMREAGKFYYDRFLDIERELSDRGENRKASDEAKRLCELSLRLINAAENSFEGARAFFQTASTSFETLTATKEERSADCYGYFKDLRTALKEYISNIYTSFFSVSPEQLAELNKKNSATVNALSAVLSRFESVYAELKQRRGGVDYNDLETFADKLFCNPDGSPTSEAVTAGEKYDHILIDEYQDTSLIQDRVFAAIGSVCGRFMVGDVKQSIYSFRGARPELFTDYRVKYTRGDGGDAIFLSENFRSDRGIIDFSNAVSELVFKCGGAPFEAEDRLICKKAGGEDNTLPCDVVYLERVKDENGTLDPDFEADYVAERILGILNGEEDCGIENISPSDIAILIRNGKKADAMAEALTKRGIPVNNGAAEQFFSYGEVLLVLCLINSTDNPLRDIYLAGALKSHIFSFTPDDLVKIRRGEKCALWNSLRSYTENGEDVTLREKCTFALETINRWRSLATERDALEMLRIILSDTGMLRYGGDKNRTSPQVTRSVKALLKTAARLAAGGGNLHRLKLHLESLIEKQDNKPFVKIPGCVNLLTVHKSKGLGFPVCFLCDTDAAFSKKSAQKDVLVTLDGQIAMKLYDDTGLVRYGTPHYNAAAMDIMRNTVEEEARVLYVAMTRAKNRLIVTRSTKSTAEALLEKAKETALYPPTSYSVSLGKSFGDWITEAVARNTPSPFVKVSSVHISDIGCGSYTPDEYNGDDSSPESRFLAECPAECDDGKSYLRDIPQKLTVSALKPDILNSLIEESSSIDLRSVSSMPKEAPLPAFMEKEKTATPADAGTATHVFLQFCDFQQLQNSGAACELERLTEKGFISKEAAETVRISEIEKFVSHPIFGRMVNAKTLLREKRFNARPPAKNFTTDPSLYEKLERDNIKLTVQGVVDCIFIDSDDKCVLLDYKTDRLTDNELSDKALAAEKLLSRHRRQLEIYRDICSLLMGRDFDEVYIYSLHLGDTVRVD